MNRVVLASASPRRRELLAVILDAFAAVATNVPEPFTGDPVADAVRLASEKARAAASRDRRATVIGADTIVFDDDRSYAKPETPDEAAAMLTALAGRPHTVVTGVTVVSGGRELTACSTSVVELTALTPRQIAAYVATGRPMDKAGAYAIQDEDVPTVARLEGCYCSVMGLPLWRLRGLLEEVGIACREPSSGLSRCAICPESRARQATERTVHH